VRTHTSHRPPSAVRRAPPSSCCVACSSGTSGTCLRSARKARCNAGRVLHRGAVGVSLRCTALRLGRVLHALRHMLHVARCTPQVACCIACVACGVRYCACCIGAHLSRPCTRPQWTEARTACPRPCAPVCVLACVRACASGLHECVCVHLCARSRVCLRTRPACMSLYASV
jgi:hypothetical protein